MIFALRQADGSLSLQIHEGEAPVTLPEGASMELKKIADSKVRMFSSHGGNLQIEILTPESPSKLKLSLNPEQPSLAPYISREVASIEDLVYSMREIVNGCGEI